MRALLLGAVIAVCSPSADASTCVPGFDYAAFGNQGVSMHGNALTDSFDSTVGTYALTHVSAGGDLGTNSVAANAVDITGHVAVDGNIDVGFAGLPALVINTTGGSTFLSSGILPSPLPLPPVTVPIVGANLGNQAINGATVTLPANNTFGGVNVTGNGTVVLQPGTYVMSSLTLTGNSVLSVPVGPVTIYITSAMDLSGGSVANATNQSANLAIFAGPAVGSIHITGGAQASMAVYAPSANVTVHGNADVYGSIVGQSISATGNAQLHYDKALQGFTGGGFSCVPIELSRSTPVIAQIGLIDSIIQGTYNSPFGIVPQITSVASVGAWSFPFVTGHMRARTVASVGTVASAFGTGITLFDAAGHIPAPINAGCGAFDGSCRQIFTITTAPPASGTTFHPPRVPLDDANADAIGALIASPLAVPGIGTVEWHTIVHRVLAGALGGVDRSTVALVPPSNLAGVGTRPTIAYFGGEDGMLHAVCASVGGTTPSQANICPGLGTELWAFLPRVQLPLIRTNTQRIDGSVRVIDAFGDFVNNPATGPKSYHTVLVFQTGFSIGTTPASYALDVTDPANPTVLWEYTQPAALGAFELGDGLVPAAGPVQIGFTSTNLAVLETNNGGLGGPGVVATAVSLETGAQVWKFGYAYPSPPRGNPLDLPLPATGIPGGAVGVDLAGTGDITDIVFGDLFGDLWRLDPTSGISRTGATPLFTFTSNKHPIGAAPAIYANGNQQFAAFASGGYADPLATTWSANAQDLIAVKLTSPPIDDTAVPCPTCNLALVQPLAAGDRGFAQALVVGTQLFVSVDSSDVNASSFGTGSNTGHVVAADLTGLSGPVTVATFAGASALASSGTTLFSSSSTQQQQLGTSATTTLGPSVSFVALATTTRSLWLRTE